MILVVHVLVNYMLFHEEIRYEVFSDKSKYVREGNVYVLLQDIELHKDSPSSAACFCTGTSMNGTTAWKDDDGITFADFLKQYNKNS